MAHAVIPAAYVYLLSDQQVLLQHRRNTGYMDGHWVAGAAGHIELFETAATCAVREAGEELGIGLDVSDLEPLTVMMRTDGTSNMVEQRVEWFFAARRWRGTPRSQEPHKCAGVRWHDLASLPHPMPEYERRVLEGFRDGMLPVFTEYGFDRA